MRLRYTEAASLDLDRLLADTAEQWPGSLAKTVRKLVSSERALMRFPKLGRQTRFNGYRRYSLAPLPYAIFYRDVAGVIEIVRIYHSAQRPFEPGA